MGESKIRLLLVITEEEEIIQFDQSIGIPPELLIKIFTKRQTPLKLQARVIVLMTKTRRKLRKPTYKKDSVQLPAVRSSCLYNPVNPRRRQIIHEEEEEHNNNNNPIRPEITSVFKISTWNWVKFALPS